MILLKKPEMQGAEISSKVKAQSSKSYCNQPLSAFSFRLSALIQRRRSGFFSGIMSVLALFFCCFMYACSQAPVTGRSQLMLVSPEQERALGLNAYENILKKERVSQDQVLNKMLQKVGWRIANVAQRPDFNWEFKLIENDRVANAFCLPGGKVFVYTGILKYTEDKTGLATVIGHEVAHAMARHGAERMSLTLLAQLGETAMQVALRTQSANAMRVFDSAYGLAANVGVMLPYSRTQEYEADHIGLILMARAGYDPRGALGFWERLSKEKSAPSPPSFLSTHPTDYDRIAKIKDLLPEALEYYNIIDN
jgi:predicted Zn-dependent protease